MLRILVTNDDGIDAPGLWAVAEALTDLGKVSVVAPDRDQSGVGTARTLLTILRVNEVESKLEEVTAHTVSGTPSDCVILADGSLFPERFDLLVSGINNGANMGLDVLDSGTFGGALRGYFHGIPSIAVSVGGITDVDYGPAARVARSLALRLSGESQDEPILYNVNVPHVSEDRIRGVKATTLGPKAYLETIESGHDGWRSHYWIKHNRPTNQKTPEGCDVWAIRNNWVSITPVDPEFVWGRSSGDLSELTDSVAKDVGLSC
ncbi:MAG: 5'/3'-nucleotidase SurE [Dehalococcoidia bacterium]|nr:5'/3'-nucleotidase SurE [Dehalococcoidia bacterium]